MIVCFVSIILLILGSALKAWENRQKQIEHPILVEETSSGHWDESEIPISIQCAKCHLKEYKQWAESDHAWAFRKLNSKLDAPAFQGQTMQAHNSVLYFSTRQGVRKVEDKETGKSWDVQYATGRVPLVQYLVKAPDGGYHTMSSSWDVKKKEWFDIFGDDHRSSRDWGHWMGRGMNWNTQCAWCHMTSYHKNYDHQTDSYKSKWVEPGVTCIQCHGPLLDKPEEKTGCMISTKRKLSRQQIHDNCAACHARRDEFDHDFVIGNYFDNHFQLVLPTQPGIFWPNGMQRDEDYCETGLRLSKMGKAGVTCIDCHDVHSATLKLPQEDNALCLRCHGTGISVDGKTKAPIIDMKTHTPCPQGSKGARCVECHMPESLYMGRDPRRDHSFNSPDPLLSKELGIPNACTMCHKDKDDDWAIEQVEKFYGKTPKMAAYRDRTRAVQWAYEGRAEALPALLNGLSREENGTWRATLLELLDTWADNPQVQAAAERAVTDDTPLARAAAAKILGRLQNPALLPLLKDEFKVVRLQAEWAVRAQLPENSAALKELVETALHQADQPSGAMKLAQISYSRKQIKDAEQWFAKALKWDPTSSVVHRDYAVFLSEQGKSAEAVEQMQKAVKLSPKDAALWYLLGLGQVENNDEPGALESFTEALKIEPKDVRMLFNRALLNERVGKFEAAVFDLENASKIEPNNADFPYTIAVFYYQRNDLKNAAKYSKEALKINPNHQNARELYRLAEQNS